MSKISSTTGVSERIERMVAACKRWNKEIRPFIPKGVEQREKDGRSIRTVIKAIIGFFMFLPTSAPRRVVLFQGLRNQYVFHLFKKDEVFIIGSWVERNFARENGYRFIPSFAVESALKIAIHRGLSWFAKVNCRRWHHWIKTRDVTVFVYEDTHPLGTFMTHLADHDTSGYRVVCIQHGHYSNRNPARPEGRMTEYNLVWDTQQVDIVSGCPEKTKVVGLNYQANAVASLNGEICVIFLGLGSDTHHTESIRIYDQIASRLREAFKNLNIKYRPHPNEFSEPKKIAECEQLFDQIDYTPKMDLLNGPRIIFVGEVSSMLYEAKQSGHLTAFVSIDHKVIPVGFHDITICINEIDTFANTINEALATPPLLASDSAANGDPVMRFATAARDLGLLPMMAQSD